MWKLVKYLKNYKKEVILGPIFKLAEAVLESVSYTHLDVYKRQMHICWAAQAGLYYHYGIPKYPLEQKLSGIYLHKRTDHNLSLIHI